MIRDLLDRLPDTQVKPEPVEFPPLPGKPKKERYSVVKPLPVVE